MKCSDKEWQHCNKEKIAGIIENLIQENIELKELLEEKTTRIGFENIENYISKSKVKEKIDVLKMKADYDWIYKYDYEDVIKILQELLEGE